MHLAYASGFQHEPIWVCVITLGFSKSGSDELWFCRFQSSKLERKHEATDDAVKKALEWGHSTLPLPYLNSNLRKNLQMYR